MRNTFLILMLLGLSSGRAFADDSEATVQQRIDSFFGEWIVSPLATVFFYDVTFWDNPPASAAEVPAEQRTLRPMRGHEEGFLLNAINGDGLESILGATRAAEAHALRPAGGFLGFDEYANEAMLSDAEVALLTLHARSTQFPIIVLWLILGAVFFTFYYRFPNLRAFGHAIEITRGKYDHADEAGEVTHFQALASALSATVGLGNIAGVALAVGAGGAGAVLWLVVAAFFGMVAKFSECTLGMLYREVDSAGAMSGGPMRYLDKGLREVGWPRLGKVLAALFAVLAIFGSFGGGNMFQGNQSYAQIVNVAPAFASDAGRLVYGLILAIVVGVVTIGGIKRIGRVAEILVPVMCGVYLLAGIIILTKHAGAIPSAFATILAEAFSPRAVAGGALGVLIIGFQRAAFSNEAGIGSASIAHSAATTSEPVREGIVALLEPFVDTVLVCTMTGLVVVVTGAYREEASGVGMTSLAFDSVLPGFRYILTLTVVLFAYSTMISWSYYGERCFTYLFGAGRSMIYRILFLIFVVLGPVLELGNVLTFSDLMVLGMALPNMLGMYFLAGKVKRAFDEYWAKYRSGAFEQGEEWIAPATDI